MTNVLYVIGLNCKACIVGLNYTLLVSLFFNRPGTRCSEGPCRDFTYFLFVVVIYTYGFKYTLVNLHSPLCSIIYLVLDVQDRRYSFTFVVIHKLGFKYTPYLFHSLLDLVVVLRRDVQKAKSKIFKRQEQKLKTHEALTEALLWAGSGVSSLIDLVLDRVVLVLC